MKPTIIFGSLVVLVALAIMGGVSTQKSGKEAMGHLWAPPTAKEETFTPDVLVPFTAYFGIYTHSIKRTFGSSMYQNLSTIAYIPSTDPHSVIVNAAGTTWGQFFETLPFKLSDTCLVTGDQQTYCTSGSDQLRFFIDGKEDSAALTRPIKNGQQLLVSYGNKSPSQITTEIQSITPSN